MKAETTIEDYKRYIVECIDNFYKETEDEDKREDCLSEAISMANRLADFDDKYYGVKLGYLYRVLKNELGE